MDGQLVFVHQQADPLDRLLGAVPRLVVAFGFIIAPDDLLAGGFPHDFVIDDPEPRHVDAHVRRRLIDALVARDLCQNRTDDRETLDVAVIIDRRLSVRLQVVRVDHIDVAEVRRRGFVCDVDRVAEGQVPDREGLKFCIAGADAPLILVIQLRQAGRQLPAARPRRRHDDERLRGLDVRVGAVAFIGHDDIDFRRVALRLMMNVRPQAVIFQLIDEFIGSRLAEILRHDDAVHIQPQRAQLIDQPQHVRAVRDPEIRPDLIALEVGAADDKDDLRLFFQRQEDAALGVALKPRKHAARVHIVEQLSAKFQIQLVVELADPLQDLLALQLDISIVIKTLFHA